MTITYTARKVTLRDNFKERVEKKLAKFQKIFSDKAEAHVVVTVEKNRQTVEITIRDNKMIYRAESTIYSYHCNCYGYLDKDIARSTSS